MCSIAVRFLAFDPQEHSWRERRRCEEFQVSAPGKAATRYVVSLNGEGRSFNSGSDRGGSRPRHPHPRDGEIGRARRWRVTSKTLLSGGCVLTLGAKTAQLHPRRRPHRRGHGGRDRLRASARGTPRSWTRPTPSSCPASSTRTVMPGPRCSGTSVRGRGAERDRCRAAIGDHFEPEDVYAATLIGLLGAVEAGITTVVDWSHDRSDAGFEAAALQAHTDAGAAHRVRHASPWTPNLRGRTPHRVRRTVDQHRVRVRPDRGSRLGRRRVGVGPADGHADPCPCRLAGLRDRRDRRRGAAGAPG